MIKVLKYIRSGVSVYISLEQYLEEYCKEQPEGWTWYCDWINKVFNIQTEMEYDALAKETQVERFDVFKVKESYIKLKNQYAEIFDADILRFIAFLLGTNYFSKIGNPTLEKWLNSKDINHPFKENQDYDFSFMEAIKYDYGQNAIRKNLMSTLRWISSQGGS